VPCKRQSFVNSGAWLLKFDAELPDLFFKQGQASSKKGQKPPTKLLKKAKHSIKKGQKRAKPFT